MANDSNRDRQNPNEDEQTRQTRADRDSQPVTQKPGGNKTTDDDQDDMEETDDSESSPATPSNPKSDRNSR